MRMLVWLVSHEALFIFFYSFCYPGWITLVDLSSGLLILSSSCSSILLTPLVKFLFQLPYFSTPEFIWFLLYNFYILVDIFYLVKHCSHIFL